MILLCLGFYCVVWFSCAPTVARRVADLEPKAYCHGRTYRCKYEDTCRRTDDPNCWRSDPMTKTEVSLHDASIGMVASALWPLALGFLPLLATQRVANRKPSRGMLQRQIVALEADKKKWEREHS